MKGSSMLSSRALQRGCYFAVVAIVMALILAPLFVVFWVSFFDESVISFPPKGYTTVWFVQAFKSETFRDSFLLSLQVGALATILSVSIGVPVALALERGSIPGASIIRGLTMMPLLVPGIVGGSAIYMFYIDVEILSGIQAAGSFVGLVAAHTLIALPWVVRLMLSSLKSMDRSAEEASMNLGANRFTTFRRVTLALIRPGLVAGALFAFIVSLADLELSLFLVGPGKMTLSIAVLNYLQWGMDPTICAVATIQIFVVGGALIISDRFVNLSRVF